MQTSLGCRGEGCGSIMKRHNHLFERIASFDNLLAAERAALRGKRRRRDPAAFHYDLEPNHGTNSRLEEMA